MATFVLLSEEDIEVLEPVDSFKTFSIKHLQVYYFCVNILELSPKTLSKFEQLN